MTSLYFSMMDYIQYKQKFKKHDVKFSHYRFTNIKLIFIGWKMVNNEDFDFFYHNFHDPGNALQLRTNSQIGTGDEVCVLMRKEKTTLYSGLSLCIHFGDEILVKVEDYQNKGCNPNVFTIQRHSTTDDRTWAIMKTRSSFEISGDEFEPFTISYDGLDQCGNLEKSTKFGWMKFLTTLSGVSSAFYLESQGKNNVLPKS